MTEVQKYVTNWLRRQGGEGVLLVGYKTAVERVHNGQSVMCCSMNVTHGLKTQKLAEFTGRFAWKNAPIYRLCDQSATEAAQLPAPSKP